jgi:hypothetical protein
MKLTFGVLVLAFAVAGASNLRFRNSEPIEVGKTVSAALSTIEKALAKNKERQGTVADLCAKEIEETKKWIDAGSGIDNKDRVAAKQQLAKALGDRIDGIKKFLGKLKNIRKNLRAHIIRVNTAFGTKYQENDNAMNAAKSAVDPAAGLKLLKLPAQDVETAEDRAEMAADSGSAAAASFLEVDDELSKSNIAELAQKLYEVASANSAQTRANIEKERSTLGAFRDKLRALILKREAKLAKLTKQLDAINKALETNESFVKDVWPYLAKHYETTQSSCKMMSASFATAEKQEGEVIDAIKNGSDKSAEVEKVPDDLTVSQGPLKPI